MRHGTDFNSQSNCKLKLAFQLVFLTRMSNRTRTPTSTYQAVESLNAVASQMPAETMNHQFLAAVQRLADGDFFAPRASACGVLPVAHKAASPDVQATLRQIFVKLATDETPMVRRAAATSLGGIAASAPADVIKAELLPLYSTLITDEQDTVRQLAVGSALQLCKSLSQTDSIGEVISSLHIAAKVSMAAEGIGGTREKKWGSDGADGRKMGGGGRGKTANVMWCGGRTIEQA